MKIVIAPNALKGSLTAGEAAQALASGIRRALPTADLVLLPVADGGDGFTEVLADALDAVPCHCSVRGPVGQSVNATFLYSERSRTAVIEMAAAAGLILLDSKRLAPMTANTRGVGELILAALDRGAERIILGIGGSATVDGGTGMAQSLGARFIDAHDRLVDPGGGSLIEIATIDFENLDPRIEKTEFQVVCDVNNPLLGDYGAARVFGPQKGATQQQVAELEAGLEHFASLLDTQLNIDVRAIPGAGAAGGLGGGSLAFLGAELQPGAELVLDLLDFDKVLNGADLVITAEGQLDGQTAAGKAPAAVAGRARAAGIPCIAIAGSLGADTEDLADAGIDAAVSLCRGPVSLEYAMTNAAQLMEATATQVITTFCAGYKAAAG